MSEKSKVVIKESEIADKSFSIDHTVTGGESLIIAVKDVSGTTKILLELKSGTLYEINIKGIITDKKVL